MLDLLNKTDTETKLDTATKRAMIDAQLAHDPARSDREIGRVCGVDHKTVRSRRIEMAAQIPHPIANSPEDEQRSATQIRSMLIAGCEDFDRKYPPGPSEVRTAEEAVDNAIAAGKVSLKPEQCDFVQAAVDQCRGAIERTREERQAKAAREDEANEEATMVRGQREITIQFRDDTGEWIIKQKNWPDDDGEIWINEEHMQEFLNSLRDRAGIGSSR